MTSGLTDTPGGRQAANVSPTPPPAPVTAARDAAVVLATARAGHGGPAALLPWEDATVLARLAGQLVDLGVGTIVVITRPGSEADVRGALAPLRAAIDVQPSDSLSGDLRIVARLAAGAAGPLTIMYGDIVTHREALARLLADPRASSGILAGGRRRPMAFRVQMRRGRMLSAASPYHSVHRPNATSMGVLKVAPADLATLTGAAERLAPLVAELPESWQRELERKAARWRRAGAPPDDDPGEDEDAGPHDVDDPVDDPPGDAEEPKAALSPEGESRLSQRLSAAPDDAVSLLLVGLVRGGAPVRASYLRRLFWARPLSPEAAAGLAERIKGYDEDRLLLDSAVKSGDGFFTTFFVSPYSKHIARWAARRGLTPNQVTTASMGIGVLAAAAFATGERWGLVAGAVLLQLAFTTDCVDGQLARYTRQFSKLGAWLDSVFDRAKEYAAFAGLAIGAGQAGDPVWLLACCAITLQTVRHMSDFSFMTVREQRIGAVTQPPLEQPLDSACLLYTSPSPRDRS